MPTRTETRRKRPPAEGKRLDPYHAKRNLAASGEPGGRAEVARTGTVRRFVIQKHDATRLHYDFRLEMDGVYRSWAVPKGLPTEAGERSLAVEVEDHPLGYGSFEGIIPEGNYGAGTVMLWDRGHYTVSGVSAETAYRQGKIHLALAGEKCVGEWTLVRMHPRTGDKHTNWLVIKNSGPAHRAPLTGAARDRSVLSGRSLEQIASGEREAAAKRAARAKPPTGRATSRGESAAPSRSVQTARKGRAGRGSERRTGRGAGSPRGSRTPGSRATERLVPAKFIPPMKALSVEQVPEGPWRLEIKFDGYRAIAVINRGEVELWSRNHNRLDEHYPEIVAALKGLPCANAVIDGEIVALDEKGHSRFQLLQNRAGAAAIPIVYYAFDLLHHDGRSLLAAPIEERQIALEVLIGQRAGPVRFSPVFDVPPAKLLGEVRRKGLEGIIAKTPGSPYEPERRSGTWLKCKVHGEQEFVIGGFTPPRNRREHFGAILVGYYDGGDLHYAGKVGSGFDRGQLASLHREFLQRRTTACPFVDLPQARQPRYGAGMTKAAMREVTWIKPQLVAQIQFTEWTNEASLRHPVFLGLRTDKKPKEVVREQGR